MSITESPSVFQPLPSTLFDAASDHGAAASSWPRGGGESLHERSIAEARRLVEGSRSAGTVDKYARAWRAFVEFVAENHPEHAAFPAHPALVGKFIGMQRVLGKSKSWILVQLAGIGYAHELIGLRPPWESSTTLEQQIRGLRRTEDAPRQEQRAIVREEATDLLATLGEPSALFDVRDRAVFTLGWLTALRRSNLVALLVRDVAIKRDDLDGRRYLEIFVAKSKTDQERKGRWVVVTELPGQHPLCAVRAVKRWLEASGIADERDTPLFRSFSLHRSPEKRVITERALSGNDVARIVKRLVAKVGWDESQYAAHALRRGFATSARRKGVRDAVAMEHGGWKDPKTYGRYDRVDKARENAVRDLFS